MKTKLQRWTHFNMAMIGGFLGGFAILNHHDLFGSAQTSNLITIAMDAVGHPDKDGIRLYENEVPTFHASAEDRHLFVLR